MSCLPQPCCPTCEARVGEKHTGVCDVARCLATGLQRSGHGDSCRCPQDIWTGHWPGEAECAEFGWLYGPGLPDLNRLYTHATWDPAARRWIRTEPTSPTAPAPEGDSP
ncbi:hypothetical protein JYK18_04440 [Amycolatopsis sp. 195334CR]|nr:hypothetical protein [Amycolatopsis sp. 195334CR]